MNPVTRNILFWAPRGLTFAFALFTSIFALDVFGHGTIWQQQLALLMHLIPTFVLLIVLALAWRWEWIGGVIYLGLAVAYFIFPPNHGRLGWDAYALIAGPMIVMGVLFLVGWFWREEVRERASSPIK
ncbi:MAG: hypothetical protein HZB25_04095 [Candidatus Eisenbacteria bacterium]|nr:hypothetical protein [Candidatus Eisenbacteria bacterium]